MTSLKDLKIDNKLPSPIEIVDGMLEYKEMMLLYESAMKMICTRLEILDKDYALRNKRNPIHFLTSRLKNTSSIIEKLNRRGFPVSVESARKNLHDIAGIRVICAYLDDVYEIARALSLQKDIKLISLKDYINSPKDNGYRSLHLIVEIPVTLTDKTHNVEVEIQIRTIAMDFWASLDHTIKYKKNIKNHDEIVEKLRYCAESIAENDIAMLSIRNSIETDDAPINDKEEILGKLRKLNL